MKKGSRSGIRINVLACLLLCLLAIYCISAAVNGNAVSMAVLKQALPYILLYCGTRILVGTGRNVKSVIVILFSLWLCRESVIGLQQVFGHRISRHAAFGMTGSFENPGPYGGFVSILLSLTLAYFVSHLKSSCALAPKAFKGVLSAGPRNHRGRIYAKWILLRFLPFVLSGVAAFLGLIVLPASASRAAWLAFALSSLLYITVETDLMRRLVRHKVLMLMTVAVLSVASAGAFFMKKDSAIGRLHIWNMEVRAIVESPWAGTGPGVYPGTYGKIQEQYFRNGGGNPEIVSIAGSPEYAFNEYLRVGMETGLPGLLTAIAVVVFSISALLKRRSPFAYGLFAAAVFSFFSYPSSVPAIAVTITIFLAVAASDGGCRERKARPLLSQVMAWACAVAIGLFIYGEHRHSTELDERWRFARQTSAFNMYDEAASELEKLYPEMFWNYRYLYEYGYALHKSGRYAESNGILRQGADISSDPMFHNIMGKNFSAMKMYELAEEEFMTAHYMVPCRLYPLVLLFDLYETTGRHDDRDAVGMKILSMPVNTKNGTMKELREKILREMSENQ